MSARMNVYYRSGSCNTGSSRYNLWLCLPLQCFTMAMRGVYLLREIWHSHFYSDCHVGEVFEFNVYHLMKVDDPANLFPIRYTEFDRGNAK